MPETIQPYSLSYPKLQAFGRLLPKRGPVAHRAGAELGEWNHDMCLTISNEMGPLKAARFSSVTVPWTDVDEKGSGRAIFVAKK